MAPMGQGVNWCVNYQQLAGQAPSGKAGRDPLGELFTEHYAGPKRPSVLLQHQQLMLTPSSRVTPP